MGEKLKVENCLANKVVEVDEEGEYLGAMILKAEDCDKYKPRKKNSPPPQGGVSVTNRGELWDGGRDYCVTCSALTCLSRFR